MKAVIEPTGAQCPASCAKLGRAYRRVAAADVMLICMPVTRPPELPEGYEPFLAISGEDAYIALVPGVADLIDIGEVDTLAVALKAAGAKE